MSHDAETTSATREALDPMKQIDQERAERASKRSPLKVLADGDLEQAVALCLRCRLSTFVFPRMNPSFDLMDCRACGTPLIRIEIRIPPSILNCGLNPPVGRSRPVERPDCPEQPSAPQAPRSSA